MRLVNGSQISLVLLGFVFASFGYLSPSRAANLPIQPLGDTNGLISLWEFEEGEGTTAYDSFGGNDGTIYGAGWTTGMIGGALSFDGVDDYVDVGNDSSLKPPLPVTLSAWIKLSSSGSYQHIITLDDQTSKYYGIWFVVRAEDNLGVSYGDGGQPSPGNRRSKVGTTVLGADTWYHIAAVLRGPTDMSLFVNGIDDGGTYSGSGGSLTYSSASSLIGMGHDSGYAFGGKIDDVRVYEEALSDEKIWELYQTGHPYISVWPETLEFDANEGGSNPAAQTISISNIGVGILNFRITEDCPWLQVDPNTGSCSPIEVNEITVNVDVTGLAGGVYNCELAISDPNAENSPQTVGANLAILPRELVSLVSLWEFEEGEGTIAHDSVGSNDGTVYGASWRTGVIGGALKFDGVDDYVNVGNDNSLKRPLPVTLSAWVNLSSSGSPQHVIALDDQTSKYYGIWWYVRSAGDLAVGYGDGSGNQSSDRRSKVGTTVLDTNTWHHIAAVLRGPTDITLYVNGIDDGGTYNGSGGSLAYSSASSLIGVRHGGGYPLSGNIDDVRVYERALSDEEIWEAYQTGLPVHPRIDVWPETLEFDADVGGSNPAAQTISIRNIGVGILSYHITESCSWLEVDPNSGTSAGETDDVTVSIDMSGLAWGAYSCELIISDPNAENSPRTVDVNLVVNGPVIEVPAEEFGFWGIEGGSNPNDQILGIRNCGVGTLKWTAASDCNWLSVEPNNGISSGEVNEVSLSVDITGLAGGVYSCEITISDPNAENSPQMVGVKLGVMSVSGLRVPSEYPTIQAAIDAAVYGDTVIVEPNIYTGTGNRDIDFRGKAITVRSIEPNDPNVVAATIIDCNASVSDKHRGFVFVNGEDNNSVLAGFTIINGYAPHKDSPYGPVYSGGGIYCLGSSPTIMNCVLSNNTGFSEEGGDPYCRPGGGGIYCEDSKAIITECVLIGNYGYVGGGICSNGGELSITGCEISGNASYYRGGGIYCGDSNPVISDCNITGNTAERDGGGICVIIGCREINNCIIRGNTCGRYGGGIHCTLENSIKNCAISCNVAGEDGGGILNWNNTSVISNCTIVANIAGNNCGGFLNEYFSDSPLVNCIVWANEDSGGTGELAQVQGKTRFVLFSCIQDDDPNDEYIPFGDEEFGNIDDNPMFVRDPNDGGDGWGVGDNDDFGDVHLQNASPCINAGSPFVRIEPNSVDIDGQPRVMGFVVDMGADEFFMPMIAVTKPEGGDVLVSGSLHEIAWESDLCGGAVDILFSKDAGSDWQTVESNLPDEGSYIWHLPDIVDSNQCLISVEPNVPDPNIVSVNSGLFTIHPDSPGPDVVSRWKTRGGDFKRTGLSEHYGPELGCLKWQFETDGPVWSSTTIGADDRVHVTCGDGRVYTLDTDNGSPVWIYDTNSELLSSPTVGPDGSVFVGSEDGKLYAISTDGTLRWTHTTDGRIYSSPAVSVEGEVYVCTQDASLYALGADGSELWMFETGGFGETGGAIFASPALGVDGTVYISGLYDSNLYALDPNDGSVRWVCHFESGGWPYASPIVAADGTIYQTLLYDPNLYAIDSNTGTIIWSMDMADLSSGWFDPDNVNRYVDGWSEPALGPDGTVYVTFNDPYLRAVDPYGNIKWVTRLGMTGRFTLAIGNDGIIYAAGEDGYLCAVDANGAEIARFESDDPLSFPVIAADNTIIVSDVNNRVWAIGDGGCGEQVSVLHRPEDLDGSRAVNLMDLALLAADWLACSNTDPDSSCNYEGYEIYLTGDIDRNLYVDFADLAALVNRWLSED